MPPEPSLCPFSSRAQASSCLGLEYLSLSKLSSNPASPRKSPLLLLWPSLATCGYVAPSTPQKLQSSGKIWEVACLSILSLPNALAEGS